MYRHNCTQTVDGIYIKDLRVIKKHPLARMLIVDNSVHSFGLQLSNGILLNSFFDDSEDMELAHLASYCLKLSKEKDMVETNSKTFNLEQLKEIDLERYLAAEHRPGTVSSFGASAIAGQEDHQSDGRQWTITEEGTEGLSD